MRFRSIGESGSNLRDYLSRVTEVETNFFNESILANLGTISLKPKVKINHGHLSSNSIYKLSLLKRNKRRKGKAIKSYYYRKKFCIRQIKEKNCVNTTDNWFFFWIFFVFDYTYECYNMIDEFIRDEKLVNDIENFFNINN